MPQQSKNKLKQYSWLICLFLLFLIIMDSCIGENQRNFRKGNITEIINTIGTEKPSQLVSPDTSTLISKEIRSILQDRKGNFWFATNGDGVCRYDGKSFIYFTEKDGLCGNFVWTIKEDKNGNKWFGTRDGICRFDGKSFVKFSDRELFPDMDYLEKMEGNLKTEYNSGDIALGAPDGIYHFNGALFNYFPLPKDVKEPNSNNYHSPYTVYCTFEDRDGNLWLGTDSRGVCRFDGKSFTYFTEKGLGKVAVRAIYQDKKGDLWFGNNGYGLFRYDGKSITNFTDEKKLGNMEFLKTSNLLDKPGTLARVWSITEDNNGNLWFGTIDAGAWRYDGKSLTNFTTKDGLTSNAIWTIYKDRSGILWFGTEGGGVCKYDGKSFSPFLRNYNKE